MTTKTRHFMSFIKFSIQQDQNYIFCIKKDAPNPNKMHKNTEKIKKNRKQSQHVIKISHDVLQQSNF